MYVSSGNNFPCLLLTVSLFSSADLGDHTTNSFLWDAMVPAGNYSLSIEDAKGNEGWSAKVSLFVIDMTLGSAAGLVCGRRANVGFAVPNQDSNIKHHLQILDRLQQRINCRHPRSCVRISMHRLPRLCTKLKFIYSGAAGSTPTDDSNPGAVGAVGGSIVGAASSMRQFSAPAMAAAALVGAIAFSL